ncbi:hypothetical protein ACPPVU_11870 [Mucilaginibacter sp. McL0603]
MDDMDLRNRFKERYPSTNALYYNGQPEFEDVPGRIRGIVNRMQVLQVIN